MASKRATIPAKYLFNGFNRYSQPLTFTRAMATEVHLPNSTLAETYKDALCSQLPPTTASTSTTYPSKPSPPSSLTTSVYSTTSPTQNPFLTTAQCTLHAFPSFEPLSITTYPSTHLLVPLRKDILHRAVIYEGDAARQGTANTLYRTEVRGSGRKIRPQKGTGRARLGDKKSPMLRGGGVAFGPKPRDHSTSLPTKIYHLALRTALSHRYRHGELLLLSPTHPATLAPIAPSSRARYLRDILAHNNLGHAAGRSLFITAGRRGSLVQALAEENMGRHAVVKTMAEVDVKDLLEMGRLVVEGRALEWLLRGCESDLDPRLRLGAWRGEKGEVEMEAEEEEAEDALLT